MGEPRTCHLTPAGRMNLREKLLEHAHRHPDQFGSGRINVHAISKATGLHRSTVDAIVNFRAENRRSACRCLAAVSELCGYQFRAEDLQCLAEQHAVCTAPRLASPTTAPPSPSPKETTQAPLEEAVIVGLPDSLPSFHTYEVRRPQEKEIIDLLKWHRMVVLTGPVGVGKTRLAVQVAREIRDNFMEGAKYVDLCPFKGQTQVLWALARALEISPKIATQTPDGLARAIGMQSLLLVIDNCGHLQTSCRNLASTLIQQCPNLRILATSDRPLRITVAHPFPLIPFSYPPAPDDRSLQIEEFGAPPEIQKKDESVELFPARARLVDPGFVPTDADATQIASICHQLAGYPLLIELAASLKGEMTLQDIDTGLRERFAGLPEDYRSVDPELLALRTVLDWVYSHLSGDEQTLLNRLSVFADSWSPEAAARVCEGEDAPSPEFTQRLHALTKRSLISYEEAGGSPRYKMRYTIRQFAQQKLASQPDAQRYYQAHQLFFLALAEQGEKEIEGGDKAKWLNILSLEHTNLCAALVSCGQTFGGEETQIRLVGALCPFWRETANITEGLEWCRLVEQNEENFQKSASKVKVLNGALQLAAHSL